jgi:hypothetical protein
MPMSVGIPFLLAVGGQLSIAVHAAQTFRVPVSEEALRRRHLLSGSCGRGTRMDSQVTTPNDWSAREDSACEPQRSFACGARKSRETA